MSVCPRQLGDLVPESKNNQDFTEAAFYRPDATRYLVADVMRKLGVSTRMLRGNCCRGIEALLRLVPLIRLHQL